MYRAISQTPIVGTMQGRQVLTENPAEEEELGAAIQERTDYPPTNHLVRKE